MAEERPGAQQWVPDRPTLAGLRGAVDACRGCELWQHATQAVMGDGRDDAPLMLLGEQPGNKEDVAGEPFVGPAGKLLDKALAAAGIDPRDVFKTNVVKHFRFSGTRGKQRIHKSPSRVHVTACGPWLMAELDVVRPTGVVLLGGTAGKALYGSGFRVGESRGRLESWPVDLEEGGRGELRSEHVPDFVSVTVHPSAVLRSRDREADRERFVADLRVVAAALS